MTENDYIVAEAKSTLSEIKDNAKQIKRLRDKSNCRMSRLLFCLRGKEFVFHKSSPFYSNKQKTWVIDGLELAIMDGAPLILMHEKGGSVMETLSVPLQDFCI